MRLVHRRIFLLSVVLLAPKPAAAQEPDPVQLWSTASIVGQATGEDAIRSEINASLDVFSDLLVGPVLIHVYMEASTTPRSGGIADRIGFANADAGTALNGEGEGRFQLSELFVTWPFPGQAGIRAGLMDLTGLLDVSRIANDENLHFLAQPFVNNPTILFPDYALAAALLRRVSALADGLLTITVSSSHGLADNPGASYEELFDVGAPDRGVFAAGRMIWDRTRWRGSVGGWISTGERLASDPEPRPLPDRGLFTVLGWTGETSALSARIGLAQGVVATEPFVGLNWLGGLGSNAVGIGLARTPALPYRVDRAGEHVEAFVRHGLWRTAHLTSSIQWLSRPLLPTEVEEATLLFGFRLSATF